MDKITFTLELHFSDEIIRVCDIKTIAENLKRAIIRTNDLNSISPEIPNYNLELERLEIHHEAFDAEPVCAEIKK